MHKFLKITFISAAILFGAVFFTHAQILDAVTGGIATETGVKIGAGVGPLILDTATGGAASTAGASAAAGAGASFLGWVSLKVLSSTLMAVSYIVGLIGSTLFTLAGLLVEFGLFLNTTILDSQVVQLGWRFSRDLANLGFTIGIVVIAYATMLGYESYGMKNLIKNFVLAAILVNFSFSIAGFMIDGSNLLTNFFVSASIGGSPAGSGTNIHNFATTLANTFGPQRLLISDQSGNLNAYEALSSVNGIFTAVLAIFFIALFTIFAALGMLAVGLTTFWRFAYLSALIIIMPLAILCYAFPNTRQKYNAWWKEFFCQLAYLPTAMFAMYLIIMFVQIKANMGLSAGQINANDLLSSFEQESAGAGGALTATKTLSLMAKPFQTITDMVIVLTLLFLGIIKSRAMGCAAGDIAIKGAEGVKNWAMKGGPATWAGRKYLSGGGTKPEENRGTRLANFMSGIPLVRRLVPGLNRFTAGTSKNIGNFETEYKGLGDVQLLNNMRSVEIRTNAERMAAAAKEAAERGLFSEDNPEKGLTQKEFEAFIPAAKRYGMDKDILKKMPHLYGKFGWDITKDEGRQKLDDLMRKDFKPEDMENLGIEALNDPEIVSRLSGAHLEKLSKKPEHRRAFSNTLDRLSNSMGSAQFAEYMGKTFSKPEAADFLMPQSLKNPLIVQNLTNAHLKRLAGSDKKEHRDALLETVSDTSKLNNKELGDFMKKNFAKGKDIDDIHPDILRNKRFFRGLDEKHIARMNAEPDENQQEAILNALKESYKDANAGIYTDNAYPQGAIEKLDRMAETIVKKKNDWQWSPLVNNPETKEAFFEIETSYRSRNPIDGQRQAPQRQNAGNDDDAYGPPAPPSPPSPPPAPPTPPSPPAPTQNPPTEGGSPVVPSAPKPPMSPAGGTAQPIPLTDEYFESLEAATSGAAQAQPTPPVPVSPPPTQKATDIQNAMDAALKNTKISRAPLPSEEAKPDTVINPDQSRGTNDI